MQQITFFPTGRAASLVATMGKHFAHKVTVEVAPDGTLIRFDGGLARIVAGAEGISIAVNADDAAVLTRLCGVIESHLLRFAQRDDPAPLVWQAG